MKKIMIMGLLLIAVVFAQADIDESFNFRRIKWGMSRMDVIASETEKPLQSPPEYVAYKVTIVTSPAMLLYVFTASDRLVSAMVLFQDEHSSDSEFIIDYKKIREILIGKYGMPGVDELRWKNSLYKDEPEDYGFAVSLGHLIYHTQWDLEETEIMLTLSGDNYQIEHTILYTSTALYEERQKDVKAQQQSGL